MLDDFEIFMHRNFRPKLGGSRDSMPNSADLTDGSDCGSLVNVRAFGWIKGYRQVEDVKEQFLRVSVDQRGFELRSVIHRSIRNTSRDKLATTGFATVNELLQERGHGG
jgi:hypothetical protein